MAHFLARIKGNRGDVTRLGSKQSGLLVDANGWNAGVTVRASVDPDGNDVFNVWFTGGSNAARSNRLIASIVGDVVSVHEGQIA